MTLFPFLWFDITKMTSYISWQWNNNAWENNDEQSTNSWNSLFLFSLELFSLELKGLDLLRNNKKQNEKNQSFIIDQPLMELGEQHRSWITQKQTCCNPHLYSFAACLWKKQQKNNIFPHDTAFFSVYGKISFNPNFCFYVFLRKHTYLRFFTSLVLPNKSPFFSPQ